MEFHEILKELRKNSGITQVQMAQKLNLASQGAYRKYETGEGFPQLERLLLISKIFNVSVSYLLGETNIKNNEINDIMKQLNYPRQEKTVRYAKNSLLSKMKKIRFSI